MKLLFATQNRHKVEEVIRIIGNYHEMITLADLNFTEELPETHFTLEENALEKAQYVFNKFKMDCFSEDTGLEIEALNGAPGIFSARYAGESKNPDDNIKKVLAQLKNARIKTARFRTVIAAIIKGKEFLFDGAVKGIILKEKRGAGGFGYDPIFQAEGFNKSFAQMTKEEKNTISHRGKAFLKLKEYIEENLRG